MTPPAVSATLRSLKHPSFRMFFAGQLVSMTGYWMQQTAQAWLVYRLTGSAFLLGVVGFSGQIAGFLLAPVAGVLTDRWDHRRTLVWAQALAALQSLALAGLALSGAVRVSHVILLSILQGFITAFDIPARQAFVVRMVENRADLGNAIALNSSMFNGARLLGPTLAGLVIAAAGEGVCFLIDSVSYLAVIATLLMMRVPAEPARPPRRRIAHELAEGVSYAANSVPIRSMLLMVAFVSLVAMPYAVLLPVVARETLRGGPSTLGLLTGMSGLGALVGSLYLAARRTTGSTVLLP